ncbi:purine-binding chemotaxis protein CheW [Bacillus sp. HMF5848]|uniref:chemotaxis protein CheW n=1 Tax=Bacillus sp. HMF5848 TaxID=2495421 RepID=UPI000F77F8A8|nr:chemotaxis protein CheW [Bacillus sp. HMF5848]RSK27765.1 purine-binding chemotaxis protein CheW [Bacillus sp. HMF5848]
MKMVVFQTGREEYGVPVQHVVSIEKWVEATVIPHMPSYMMGVAKIRGELVPILDSGLIFFNKRIEKSEKVKVLVMQVEGFSFGVLVDDAKEILDVEEDSIKQVNVLAFQTSSYFSGVVNLPERLITLVEPAKLYAKLDELEEVRNQIATQ